MSTATETWVNKTDCATVRSGEIQADIATWANLEGVTVSVSGKEGRNLLVGSLRWEEMETLCAAFSLLKAKN